MLLGRAGLVRGGRGCSLKLGQQSLKAWDRRAKSRSRDRVPPNRVFPSRDQIPAPDSA